jgi:hypothetical protein
MAMVMVVVENLGTRERERDAEDYGGRDFRREREREHGVHGNKTDESKKNGIVEQQSGRSMYQKKNGRRRNVNLIYKIISPYNF